MTADSMTIKQFVVGHTYSTRSIADYDVIFSFKILARTAKTVSFNDCGRMRRRGIFVYEGAEQFRPHGNYSMSAIISADRTQQADFSAIGG